MSRSLENSSFPRKQPVTIFWSNAHAWLYLGFMAKMKSMQKVLVNDFFAWKEKKKSPETRNLVIYDQNLTLLSISCEIEGSLYRPPYLRTTTLARA